MLAKLLFTVSAIFLTGTTSAREVTGCWYSYSASSATITCRGLWAQEHSQPVLPFVEKNNNNKISLNFLSSMRSCSCRLPGTRPTRGRTTQLTFLRTCLQAVSQLQLPPASTNLLAAPPCTAASNRIRLETNPRTRRKCLHWEQRIP